MIEFLLEMEMNGVVCAYYHTFPNGLFLFTAGLFYKKWDGSKISLILFSDFVITFLSP